MQLCALAPQPEEQQPEPGQNSWIRFRELFGKVLLNGGDGDYVRTVRRRLQVNLGGDGRHTDVGGKVDVRRIDPEAIGADLGNQWRSRRIVGERFRNLTKPLACRLGVGARRRKANRR